MTPKEKLDAAIVEFLESQDCDIKELHGYKLRAIVKHNPSGHLEPDADDVFTAVNYYSTHEYLRRAALDAPTTNYELYAR